MESSGQGAEVRHTRRTLPGSSCSTKPNQLEERRQSYGAIAEEVRSQSGHSPRTALPADGAEHAQS